MEPDATEAWPWVLDPSLQAYPDHPLLDSDSAWILAQAVTELAVIRCPALGMADSLADLHASMSLIRQGQAFLTATVADARCQGRCWPEIAAQLEVRSATARRRYDTRSPRTGR
jgi:hypothetical protein